MKSKKLDLRTFSPDVQTLVRHARKLLLKWLPDARETKDASARMIAYAYGPGYRGTVCTVVVSKVEIKIGIFNGSCFPDPENLMRGSGKNHRHVPIKTADDLRHPGLKLLVGAASTACKIRLQL